MTDQALITRLDNRLDQLVNIDMGERGVEHLFDAARELQGGSLVGAAADALMAVPRDGTVILTTGSVSRAWITPQLGENDGPSGAAAIARALVLGRNTTCIMMCEDTLLPAIQAVMVASGLFPVTLEQAHIARADKSLATIVMLPYPTEDAAGEAAATEMLDDLKPDLLFSTERVGRNDKGIYHSMRGIDYGMGRARIDHLFDKALERGIPVVAVGDGGNEIGMGKVADHVKAHVPYGDQCQCGCGGGIGAVTSCDVLVTAACSNWGCTAIAAAMAVRAQDARLLHTPKREALLLDTMVANGLINSTHGLVDDSVDGFERDSHIAIAELCRTIVSRALQ
ncbi:glutamate cyclase domain-containing protein [Cochlodiniinecator piscidefendens]|uniref:glutamate cyclase domain-containing protein n=1 Tax=Cochlodiniinecator piscidefendens TaxID=2715756 RepID=UPI00140E63B5|nr:glutamate cyclase domain-containing protein [Cochlodiniinecator piscidefendens]